MPTFAFDRMGVANFDALVGMPFNLKSPFRSTVPLLAYWVDAAGRLGKFADELGLPLAEEAILAFESTVNPPQGRGEASHTDLMIRCPGIAVATEAKYTEGPYETVAEWLGPIPTNNRLQVLQGWLVPLR